MSGTGLHVIEQPADRDGATRVVLVHGAMDRSRTFVPVLDFLDDYDVILYDRRGHGASVNAQPDADGVQSHADDVLAILGEEPATIVGHSFGGAVALTVAARRPDLVSSLGVFEPAVHWMGWVSDEDRAASIRDSDQVWPGFETTGVRSDQRDAERDIERSTFERDIASINTPPFALEGLQTKVIVGYGTKSWRHAIEISRRLAEALDAPLVEIEGAPHDAHKTHPEDFADFVHAAVRLGRPSLW